MNELETRYQNLPCQQSYAKLLGILVNLDLALLILTFAIYSFGLIDPLLPIKELTAAWGLPAGDYIARTGGITGWGWALKLNYGDYIPFIGIAFLASNSMICYAIAGGMTLRRGRFVIGFNIVLDFAVSFLAASDLLHNLH
ncbi:MAG: hypothetical protein A2527_03920 [Candidatus Lambdaproteobacteria bacterium RIFOXYD2_FULL_50_16]|uniref:Uncharacterized protein n=1 Tax=Candidatus Lambdaproteobacteria bacterium RIFOXYD2_FULL_50_16 TaxID=1817772 RepID=A0A1F6GF39_9PROT|nr:MAG: hypothetical protein A2527_03920 [Candidatus Lambdaproteobacteria bacterium RIFOXYD2_FULL_50_16]